MKIEQNKQAAEEKTAKKRARRLRKKKNSKLKGKQPKKTLDQTNVSSESDSSSEDERAQNDEKMQDTSGDKQQSENDTKTGCKEHSDNIQNADSDESVTVDAINIETKTRNDKSPESTSQSADQDENSS